MEDRIKNYDPYAPWFKEMKIRLLRQFAIFMAKQIIFIKVLWINGKILKIKKIKKERIKR